MFRALQIGSLGVVALFIVLGWILPFTHPDSDERKRVEEVIYRHTVAYALFSIACGSAADHVEKRKEPNK